MHISLVICTKDRPDELKACLDSIRRQTLPPEEVVIVDASRSNGAKGVCRLWQHTRSVELKYVSSRPGLSIQRNIGVENSKGHIVGFLDDDLVLDKWCLESVKSLFQKGPDLGGASCFDKAILEIPWWKSLFWKVFMLPRFDGKGRIQRSGYPAYLGKFACDAEVECVTGTAFYRREVFDKFRFDEEIPASGGMEDVDFSFRVSKRYRLIQSPEVKVYHRHSTIARCSPEKLSYMMVYYHHYFFKKHMDNSFLNRLCLFWSCVGEVLRSTYWAIKAKCLGPFVGIYKAYRSILNGRPF